RIQTTPDRRDVFQAAKLSSLVALGGALKIASAFDGKGRDLASATGNGGWASAVGWSVVIGTVYFLTSRLGLSLLVPPSDVAVFWPASGIGAGILVAFGRRALPSLAVGLMVGAVAADLLRD